MVSELKLPSFGNQLNDFSEIASAGGKGRIPWAQLRENQDNFILPEYLPDGYTLTQYHHIRLEDANALLKHWTQRQASGEVPFRFKNKNSPMPDRRRRRTLAVVNAPTPAGPSGQPEGDHRDTGSRRERGNNGEDQEDGENVTGNVR